MRLNDPPGSMITAKSSSSELKNRPWISTSIVFLLCILFLLLYRVIHPIFLPKSFLDAMTEYTEKTAYPIRASVTENSERTAYPMCPHVYDLYFGKQEVSGGEKGKVKEVRNNPSTSSSSSWDMSKEHVLVLGSHGGPHADTLSSLQELGFPTESIYSICKWQFCFLQGFTGIGNWNRSGYGLQDDMWANKKITGTDPTMFDNMDKISGIMTEWINLMHRNKTTSNYFNDLIKQNTSEIWNGGQEQENFDTRALNATKALSAVVCPFPSYICAPFMDDKYRHLKVILRLTHRLTHHVAGYGPKHVAGMRAVIKRMAEDPSRFLLTSGEAFDVAATRSWADGNDWTGSDVTGKEKIPGLNIAFWPSYYRHVREWSPSAPDSTSPFVISVGHNYRVVTKEKYTEFTKALDEIQKNKTLTWRLEKKPSFQRIGAASLAIIYPYSTHSAKVNELYAMSVPMLCPSRELLISTGKYPSDVQPHIGFSDEFLTNVRPRESCIINNSNNMTTPLDEWTAWSDAYTHPYIHYFDSFESLPDVVDRLMNDPHTLNETRHKMREHWDNAYGHTTATLKKTFEKLFTN